MAWGPQPKEFNYLERNLDMAAIMLKQGIKITAPEPFPRGFAPLTATSADLQKYGFPPRPSDPRHLERYKRVFAQLKNKGHYVAPTFRVNEETFHGKRGRRPTDATETSTNWSGGVVFAPSGDSFRWIEGDG